MINRRLANEKARGWPDDWTILSDNNIFIPISLPAPLSNGVLTVELMSSYPFKSPRMYYNGKGLGLVYRTGRLFHKDMTLISGYKCLCCDTFLCYSKWHCTHQIKDMVDEFLKVVAYKTRVVERFLCKKIEEKYLHNVPIHEYL